MPAMPIIVAHRGLHSHAPENSLAAFVAAVEAKLPWVECDVWPSADGVPVVIHDQTLDRTTTSTGNVAQHPWAALRKLNVPSLSEVLDVLDGTGILVEIKPPNAGEFVDRVLDLLRGYRGPWMIQSFHLENVEPVARSVLTAFLIEDPRALTVDWPRIHVDYRMIDQKLVQSVHAARRKIGAWTVNAPPDIQRMIDLGIDMLITDEPDLARQMIKQTPSRF